MTATKNIITIFLISYIFSGCIVNRLERPEIEGYVFDYQTNLPIADCKIEDTKTNQTGYFSLPAKTYHEFVFPGKEAPPIAFKLFFEHRNYKTDSLQYFSQFGGGGSVNNILKIDTIFLKNNNLIELSGTKWFSNALIGLYNVENIELKIFTRPELGYNGFIIEFVDNENYMCYNVAQCGNDCFIKIEGTYLLKNEILEFCPTSIEYSDVEYCGENNNEFQANKIYKYQINYSENIISGKINN